MTGVNKDIGLLKGVAATGKDWYTEELSPSAELSEGGHFFEAATADAKSRNWSVDSYLKQLKVKMTSLMGKEGEVFDRVILKQKIREQASNLGSLNFITGSRSIGKTRLLKELEKEYQEPDSEVLLVYVDGRQGNVATGIKKALNVLKEKQWWERIDWANLTTVMQATKTAAKPLVATNPNVDVAVEAGACGLSHVFGLLQATGEDEDSELVSLITDLAKKQNKTACLIIDEANRVAKAGTDTALLAKIVSLTKSEFEMSVMLCTSVHAYPGIMTEHLNLESAGASFVEEFSPSVMKGILKDTLEMGPDLMRLCIASCGGNLLRVHMVINRLFERKDSFTPLKHLYTRIEGEANIASLMQEDVYKEVIVAMTKEGYWETTMTSHNIEKHLIEMGVASKVEAADLVEGSPLLSFPDAFLVPSSQALRVYIVNKYPDEFSAKSDAKQPGHTVESKAGKSTTKNAKKPALSTDC